MKRNPLNLNEKLYGRLYNWKFDSALRYLKGEPKEVQKAVRELAEEYGNIGWVYEGKISDIIAEKVNALGIFDENEVD
jgi:hypothetical protein